MPSNDPFNADFQAVNPYAVPVTASAPTAPPTQFGIWREGNVLVMHKMATLPDICIKSNEPTDGFRLKRKLSWHYPLIAITVLISPLIYIILAAVLSKRATIHIGLTEQWRQKRKTRIMIAWTSVLAGTAGLIGGIMMLDPMGNDGAAGLLILAGILVLIFGILFGLIGARLISPRKIDDQYVYIKGAHPGFLDRFPAVQVPV